MTALPDEIWADALAYLDPLDLVSLQKVSRRLLQLARDRSIWRCKVFEKAPSAAHHHATRPNALSELTGVLSGLSVSESTLTQPDISGTASNLSPRNRGSQRAKAVLNWDKSHPNETIDWYSEYIARHAPLSTIWAECSAPEHEVRGMALLDNAEKVIGTIEDGRLGIWDIQQTQHGRRKLHQVGRSRKGLLFEDVYNLGESSYNTRSRSLGAAVENISLDSNRMRAFVAVGDTLNEVDLEKMEVVSQNKFAWPITGLSQENKSSCNLTVGTSFSLHLHDPRLPIFKSTDNAERLDSGDDSKIAFFQNYGKASDMRIKDAFDFSDGLYDYRGATNRIEAYARVEPGPQSILHRGENEILIAGRMPSILFYDRRNFPQPRTGIHSGARLSAMTILPFPPSDASPDYGGDSTLIACGEYGGRGSLEIYELPYDSKKSFNSTERGSFSSTKEPFSFRNRQEASSSKLLSVATQGTRIVFSDSEGMLKWVERDGRGLARRWNINAFQMNERGASVCGDKVIRKMIPLPELPSKQGIRGDGDLLVWTGEKVGIVTTKPKPWDDHEELVQAFERGMDLNAGDRPHEEVEAEYSTMMRRALERQADERRWMSRFGTRRW